MGSYPLNLALRFVLELIALISLGYWGAQQYSGVLSILLAVGLPIFAAVLWGTFAVPNDPSRSGKAPVTVRGLVRLILELALFIVATAALIDAGVATVGFIFVGAVALHYITSYDRVAWLLRQNAKVISTEDSR